MRPPSCQPIARYRRSAAWPARVSSVSSERPAARRCKFRALHQGARQAVPACIGMHQQFLHLGAVRGVWRRANMHGDRAGQHAVHPAAEQYLGTGGDLGGGALPEGARGLRRERGQERHARTAGDAGDQDVGQATLGRCGTRRRRAVRCRSPVWRRRIPASSRCRAARGSGRRARTSVSHRTGARDRTAYRSIAGAVRHRRRSRGLRQYRAGSAQGRCHVARDARRRGRFPRPGIAWSGFAMRGGGGCGFANGRAAAMPSTVPACSATHSAAIRLRIVCRERAQFRHLAIDIHADAGIQRPARTDQRDQLFRIGIISGPDARVPGLLPLPLRVSAAKRKEGRGRGAYNRRPWMPCTPPPNPLPQGRGRRDSHCSNYSNAATMTGPICAVRFPAPHRSLPDPASANGTPALSVSRRSSYRRADGRTARCTACRSPGSR